MYHKYIENIFHENKMKSKEKKNFRRLLKIDNWKRKKNLRFRLCWIMKNEHWTYTYSTFIAPNED